jgi:tetratricopeptide (TPR) repeat protein
MEYSTLAGDRSAHAFANAEAIEEYARAIDAASKLPLAATGTVGDLHAKRGSVLSVIGRHQEALDEYASALDDARSASDSVRECHFLLGLGWAQHHAHQFEAELETFNKSRILAADLGDVTSQAASTAAIALARLACEGGTPEIMERAEEAVRLAESLPQPQVLAHLQPSPNKERAASAQRWASGAVRRVARHSRTRSRNSHFSARTPIAGESAGEKMLLSQPSNSTQGGNPKHVRN